eukprot:38383-Chlamydomonas_euryale.AAC.3
MTDGGSSARNAASRCCAATSALPENVENCTFCAPVSGRAGAGWVVSVGITQALAWKYLKENGRTKGWSNGEEEIGGSMTGSLMWCGRRGDLEV